MIILCVLVQAAVFLVLARLVLSWISTPPSGPLAAVARGVYLVSEPPIAAVRSVVRPVRVGSATADLSPWIVVLVLTLVGALVCR